ncbi:unnamed protein product [Thelazia callipaeda]|uniref:Fe2OG dioxygenase domain-containing protein n=1 Tax=Thelazia callipaeda TaxID=103827 RepID=A0A0N5CYA8_THECL|nr:unnamed protein product [Thelazia callipaeda]
MVGWQLRLTPKRTLVRSVVAVIGLAIGAYGVGCIYKPLQTNWIYVKLNCYFITRRNMMIVSEKLPGCRMNQISRNYNDSSYHDELHPNSSFKQIFKYYKRHDIIPDLSEVLDLRHSSAAKGICCSRFEPIVLPSKEILKSLKLRPISEWTASTIAHRPGMVLLNNIFETTGHLEWIKRSLFVYTEPPGFTNVGLQIPNARNVFREHAKRLRWTTLGLHYNWTTKIYPPEGVPLPAELVSLSDIFSQALGLGPMFADAAIINFYSRKATLAPHVDKSERELAQPIISLSFGQTAVFLAGGLDLNCPIDAFYIHSGDVLIMYGSQRLIYHAVPRILQNTLFEEYEQFKEVVNYANGNRVNITIRQVNKQV